MRAPGSNMPQSSFANYDPVMRQQLERLHRTMVWLRWLVVMLLWLILAPLSVWSLRSDIHLWLNYFTWTAVRYALAYNHLAAIGLSLCIGATVGVLIWQSRNILLGFPDGYVQRLEREVLRIRHRGQRHPLWTWVCRDTDT